MKNLNVNQLREDAMNISLNEATVNTCTEHVLTTQDSYVISNEATNKRNFQCARVDEDRIIYVAISQDRKLKYEFSPDNKELKRNGEAVGEELVIDFKERMIKLQNQMNAGKANVLVMGYD